MVQDIILTRSFLNQHIAQRGLQGLEEEDILSTFGLVKAEEYGDYRRSNANPKKIVKDVFIRCIFDSDIDRQSANLLVNSDPFVGKDRSDDGVYIKELNIDPDGVGNHKGCGVEGVGMGVEDFFDKKGAFINQYEHGDIIQYNEDVDYMEVHDDIFR